MQELNQPMRQVVNDPVNELLAHGEQPIVDALNKGLNNLAGSIDDIVNV
jgi:hypothetical protein